MYIEHGSQCVRARGSGGHGGLTLPLKASTAENRRTKGRLKRNRCLRSTLETSRFGFGAYPYVGASLGLAFFAAFWVVLEFFFVEDVLLTRRENELGIAVNALQNPVRKIHGLLSTASEISGCRVRVGSMMRGWTVVSM
jgi:hypothetical protein